MNAQQKRDQQQAEYEKRRAADAIESARYKAAWPAMAKEQRRKAITLLSNEIEKAPDNQCEVIVWELDRRLEDSVVRHLKKQGYTLLLDYVSMQEGDYDGRLTGRTLLGTKFRINW
jgi:hypothetical protein